MRWGDRRESPKTLKSTRSARLSLLIPDKVPTRTHKYVTKVKQINSHKMRQAPCFIGFLSIWGHFKGDFLVTLCCYIFGSKLGRGEVCGSECGGYGSSWKATLSKGIVGPYRKIRRYPVSSKWHYRHRKTICGLAMHFMADTDTDENCFWN